MDEAIERIYRDVDWQVAKRLKETVKNTEAGDGSIGIVGVAHTLGDVTLQVV